MNSPELQSVLLGIIEVRPLTDLLRDLAAAAQKLTGADYAALGAYDEGRRLQHFETTGVPDDVRAAIPHAPHGVGLLGEFAIDPHTVQLPDFRTHRAAVRFPAHHPDMEAFLGVPLSYGGRVVGAFYVTRRPGAVPFSDEDRAQLEALAPYAAIAIHNAQEMETAQHRRAAAETLADAARALQGVDAPEGAAAALVRAAVELVPAGSEVVVCWADDHGDEVRVAASPEPSRLAPEVIALMDVGIPPGRHERPGLLPGADGTIYVGDLPDGGQFVLAVAVPAPAGDDARLPLRALLEIGVSGYAHLAQREAEAALERYATRDGIARDLHDDIIQAIYAVGLGLHRARVRDTVSKDEALDRATSDLNAVIADLRAYIAHLTGDELPGTDLLTARLRSIFDAPTAVQWEAAIELGHDPLPRTTERAVYLITRELISNVERHAQAQHASLRLRCHEDEIHIEVQDDGIGFDRGGIAPEKVGVRSVEQRVTDLGGSLLFTTARGEGTHVSVSIPLRRVERVAP